jgi:hypothetical protein
MSVITGLATTVVGCALVVTVVAVAALTYYGSGAPAARYALRVAAARRIEELHNGSFTVPQRIGSRLRATFGPKHLIGSGRESTTWRGRVRYGKT